LDKGAKGRTRTVLSLFDEDEDKVEDESSTCAPQDGREKVSKEWCVCKRSTCARVVCVWGVDDTRDSLPSRALVLA
jgi:hypothetical protein